MAAMGFVGKNIECADQLLREGDRDDSERGRKMRQVGLAVIASMIQAPPGRQYDMKGPGWQQEHWRLGPGGAGRGVGSHRSWLPWVSANHLYSITGLDEYDPQLFRTLSDGPTSAPATP